MQLEGAEALRLAIQGSALVLLTATSAEAAPLLDAMAGPAAYLVTTKKVFVGRLRQSRGFSPSGRPAPRTTTQEPLATLAIGGCDKANTAHILTCLLQAVAPDTPLVMQVGVGGAFAYPGSSGGARVGDIVLATKEIYSDTGSSGPFGWLSAADLRLPLACIVGDECGGEFVLDERLVHAAAAAIETEVWSEPSPKVVTGPCVTASRATGLLAEGEDIIRRWRPVAESMEGAAAAHVCALYRVPFLEVRGISNLILDRDRSSWEVDRAVAVAGRAALAVAAALDTLPLGSASPRDDATAASIAEEG